MIYDKLPVVLLSALATEPDGSTNSVIAHYLVDHLGELDGLTVKGLAAACHVGSGSVSRFCREVGFESFDDLRNSFAESRRSFQRVESHDACAHAKVVEDAVERVAKTIDRAALARLADDLAAYGRVSAYGMLKAQSAAIDLQVDLLMLGKHVDTCVAFSDQLERICRAGRDELVVVFSYTGSYFDYRDVAERLARIDRPKIWVVCGQRRPLPSFVADALTFDSGLDQLGHPFQLEMAEALLAQEYARRVQ